MKAVTMFIVISLMALQGLFAGDVLYKVSDIPAELKEKARSVIRNEEQVFEVISVDKGVLKVTCVITVLNKNGIEDAYFHEYYDKFRTVSGIKGRVFDEDGELIKRIAPDEIDDFSAISGYSVFEDSRVKFIDPKIRTVPFTVEYSYEVHFNGLFQYPHWLPHHDYNISVEKSSFKAIIPKGLEFRYLEKHPPATVALSSDEKYHIFYWEAANLKAMEPEPFTYHPLEIFPTVLMAPSEFEIGGYAGNAASWQGLGDWYCRLSEGLDVLPEETVAFLKALASKSGDEYNTIREIYEYMQGRVRYVNLSIGIGGWQPVDAATVQRLSYGDCKALTNYMQAMLTTVGIKSYCCLVSAGESPLPLYESFPSSQFNHVFLCVPVDADTLWLECTSQRKPCGYIGSSTDDREVLLIEKGNSKIVRSRQYGPDDNQVSRLANIRIDDRGTGTLEMKSVYKGLKYDEILSTYLADDADKKKLISDKLMFPAFKLISFNYKESKGIIPSMEELIHVNFENYLTTMSTSYLMPLNCTGKVTASPPNVRNRKTDLVLRHAFGETDTICYSLPATLKVESLPKPVDIVTPFGEYHASVSTTGEQVVYIRHFTMNKGIHPPAAYADFIDFFDRVAVADDMKCILVRK